MVMKPAEVNMTEERDEAALHVRLKRRPPGVEQAAGWAGPAGPGGGWGKLPESEI